MDYSRYVHPLPKPPSYRMLLLWITRRSLLHIVLPVVPLSGSPGCRIKAKLDLAAQLDADPPAEAA